MRGGPEPGHVTAGLGDDHRSAFAVNIRDGHQVLDRVGERGEFGVDPCSHLLDDGAQFIDPAQDNCAKERVVVIAAHPSNTSIDRPFSGQFSGAALEAVRSDMAVEKQTLDELCGAAPAMLQRTRGAASQLDSCTNCLRNNCLISCFSSARSGAPNPLRGGTYVRRRTAYIASSNSAPPSTDKSRKTVHVEWPRRLRSNRSVEGRDKTVGRTRKIPGPSCEFSGSDCIRLR